MLWTYREDVSQVMASPDLNKPPAAQKVADANDTLIAITGPILAGFSLAAIVVIGTSASNSGRPAALPAMTVFAAAAVLLLFAIQMLAVAALPGLQNVRWPGLIKGALYETGLLAFLAGLGLFLWTRSWSATAMAGLAVVGLAIVGDLALLAASWSRLGRWATPTQGDGGRALSPPRSACAEPTAVKCRPLRCRHAHTHITHERETSRSSRWEIRAQIDLFGSGHIAPWQTAARAQIGGSARGYQELFAPLAIPTTAKQADG